MKLNQTNEAGKSGVVGNSPSRTCLKSCQGVLGRIGRAKDAIFAEARATLKVRDRMLRLALNEAEALAWQTFYPHLVFPALAVEKVQGIAAWNNHQQLIGRRNRSLNY